MLRVVGSLLGMLLALIGVDEQDPQAVGEHTPVIGFRLLRRFQCPVGGLWAGDHCADRHLRPHRSRGVFRFGRGRVPLLLGHPFGLLGIAQVVRRHDLHPILVEHVLDIGVQQAQKLRAWPGL